ncbi:MAG TPA: alpha/beta fold hydrolase [Ktedonobacterales bacterium]|nr:alpha/beta fold hydrolase [Ktedonobacterales bacterium]
MRLEVLSRQPAAARPTPLLFVHGAWLSASCWDEHFLGYFSERGYPSYALSLRGHGASEGPPHLRDATIADYVADVARVAGDLPSPPVVIGHSMGGLVVQKYLETHSAPAAALLASVPPSGALRTTLNIARKHPFRFAYSNVTRSLYPLVSRPRLAREIFFSPEMTEEEVQAYARRIQDESFRAFLDMIAFSLPRPKRVKTPLLVLGGGRDAVFTPHEVAATARAYNTRPRMFANMAHAMMLEANWQDVAYAILAWLRERGL